MARCCRYKFDTVNDHNLLKYSFVQVVTVHMLGNGKFFKTIIVFNSLGNSLRNYHQMQSRDALYNGVTLEPYTTSS